MNISKRFIKVFILCLVAGYALSIGAGSVTMPKVRTITLPNDLKVFYVHDELPLVTIALSVGFGSLYEDQNNAGIASILQRSLTLGGSKKYPGQKLHNTIEQIGGKFSISSSWEQTVISVTVLKKYKQLAFDIVSDIAKNPLFTDKAVNHAKMLAIEGIKRRNDSPNRMAIQKVRNLIFNGKGYGATETFKTVKAVTPAVLKKLWKTYVVSKNIMVGVSSSLNFREVKSLVKPLATIKAGTSKSYDPVSKIDYEKLNELNNTIYLIPKKLPQSTVVCGTIAPVIKSRDVYALTLMNRILGGGSFSSRLMREIRVQRGLAYVVQSVIRSRSNTGVFLAFSQTKNASVKEVVSIMKRNFKDISQKNVSTREIQWAKRAINNSYIFNFETPLDLLGTFFFVHYNKMPKNYHETYLSKIKAVSKKDIKSTAKDLFSKGMVYVVVGPESLKTSLGSLGKVVVVK